MTIYKEMMLRRGFGLQTRLYQIERDLVEGRVPHEESLRRFRTEWPGVVDICAWCVRQKNEDLQAAMLLSKLVGVVGHLAHLALSVPEQLYWREEAYSAAKVAQLAHDELGHGAQLAYLHFASGNAAQALKLLEELLARNECLVESPGDAKLTGKANLERSADERQIVRATLLSHRGMFFATTNRDEEAIPALMEAAAFFREHDPPALALCLNTLAVVQDHLGKPEEALKTVNEALALSVHGSKATALINRGGYLDSLGRVREALESLEEGDRVARANGEQSAVALASVQLALWRIRHGDEAQRAQAVNWLEQSLDLCSDAGDERLRMRVLDTLGQVLVAAIESNEASAQQRAQAWRKLASVREQLGNTELEVEAVNRYLACAPDDLDVQLEGNLRLGHAFVKLKQPEKALSHHEAALVVLAKMRDENPKQCLEKAEVELLLSMGQAFRHGSHPERAIETNLRARGLAEALGDDDALWRARGNLAVAQVDCGRANQALLGLEQVVAHYGQEAIAGGKPDLRLLGHARINLAYAYHLNGDADAARKEGNEALRILSLANDQTAIQETHRQMSQW